MEEHQRRSTDYFQTDSGPTGVVGCVADGITGAIRAPRKWIQNSEQRFCAKP